MLLMLADGSAKFIDSTSDGKLDLMHELMAYSLLTKIRLAAAYAYFRFLETASEDDDEEEGVEELEFCFKEYQSLSPWYAFAIECLGMS